MQLIKTLSVLAIATGAAVAMPANVQKRSWRGSNNRWWDRPSPDAAITATGYDAEPTDWSNGASTTSATSTTVAVVVSATPIYGGGFYNSLTSAVPTPTQAPASSSAPAAQTWAAAPAPSTGSSGGQDGYMGVVSKWRAAGGLPALSQDSTLEANAMKTSTDSTNGLEHELNPGTFAQVLAPGDAGNFESVYVGGWLCEVPSLPGLDGICSTEAQGWDHSDGETGHADILSSTKYTKIGCALSGTGVWACDLA